MDRFDAGIGRLTRTLLGLVLVLALGTIFGMALLWPGEVQTRLGGSLANDSEKAEVEVVREVTCPGLASGGCQLATVRLESGPDSGRRVRIALSTGNLDPDLDSGDDILVTETPAPVEGAAPIAGTGWALYDFQRGTPMLLLAALFVGVVLIFARLKGALSLVGLAISLAVVVLFVVPSILDGKPPLAVAIVGSLAIALVTIPLAHGLRAKSLAAILGTCASLLLVALLAVVFTELTHLTGLSSEEATFLQLGGGDLSLEGLLLAGMVIGALGVLDDVTITQASTVLALRDANPELGLRELVARALRVGRDHVSATVNTLVLAYVGAALPVLLIFSSSDLGAVDVVNLELVSKEVVATLVGSIGLIAAVPVTTLLAAALALAAPAGSGADAEPPHVH
ncbi:MAG TPA: YibE/F family protein [Thermoleophilaceae bacterium]|nr:YibE/F family protein [Thermoleophilaceae bacterium]